MGYYKSGDYGGGGYYRGYYSGGGFLDTAGKLLHSALRNPLAQAAAAILPGPAGLILKGATAAAAMTKISEPAPAPPSAASMPGHATQTITSGGMMSSHQTQMPPAGTPGHVAHQSGTGGAGPARHRRSSHRRRASSHRRRSSGHRTRRRGRSRASGGDIRRAASGRFLTGHRAPRRRSHRRGGTVSFVTKDGRRVSFSPRGA